MPALAGVPADDEGQRAYLNERHEECAAEESPAGWTARRVVAGGFELVNLAEGAAEGVCPGGYSILHFPHLSH